MSWHYLQGQEAASWEGICLDGAPDALLSLMPTPEPCCCNARLTDVCQGSRSGTTCELSMESLGAEVLMSLAVDFPAPTFQQQGLGLESKESTAGCGLKWRELSERYDPALCSWRTHHSLLSGGLPWSSVILPKWGMTRGGVVFQHPTLARPMKGIGSGLWPTPCAGGGQTGGPVGLGGGSAARAKLLEICKDEQEAKAMGCGKLNPQFAEWLLGWPINWTSTEPQDCGESATAKFQQWRQWHGGF
jgi:hypothetical protein